MNFVQYAICYNYIYVRIFEIIHPKAYRRRRESQTVPYKKNDPLPTGLTTSQNSDINESSAGKNILTDIGEKICEFNNQKSRKFTLKIRLAE